MAVPVWLKQIWTAIQVGQAVGDGIALAGGAGVIVGLLAILWSYGLPIVILCALAATACMLLIVNQVRQAETRPNLRGRALPWVLISLKELAVSLLLNRPVSDGTQVAKLGQDLDVWDKSVLDALSRMGATEGQLSQFRKLVTMPAKLGGLDNEHARIRNMIAEKTARIDTIVAEMEGRVTQRQ